MTHIVWLIDANEPHHHESLNKVIRLASAFKQRVNIVINRRLRSAERWYWKYLPVSEKVHKQVTEFQNTLLETLSTQLNHHQIAYQVHEVSAGDYLASLDQLVIENALLVIQRNSSILQHPVFVLTKKYNCNILLLSNQPWSESLSIAACVDPLHEHDRPAILDQYIVSFSQRLCEQVKGIWCMVHCCFISPILLEHKNTLISIHREQVEEFAQKNAISNDKIILLQDNPEHILPTWVKQRKIDILCLGYIARNRLENYLVGSTTHALLKAPPCDMLMLHQSDS